MRLAVRRRAIIQQSNPVATTNITAAAITTTEETGFNQPPLLPTQGGSYPKQEEDSA